MGGESPTVLVMGASGALGSAVVSRLAAAGYEVRAASRDPARVRAAAHVHPVAADVRQRDSVRGVAQAAQVVVSSIHGLAPPTRKNHPGIVDGNGVSGLIATATAAGVHHFVLMSAQGAAPDAPSRFLRIKHQSETLVRSSGMRYTILRPPAFMEVHALRFMGEPLLEGKPVAFVGSGRVPIEWISTQDVADVIVRSIVADDGSSATIALEGAETMSRMDALDVLESVTGLTGRRRHLPTAAARTIKVVGGMVNPGLGYLLEMALAEGRPAGTSTPVDRDVTGTTRLDDVARAWSKSTGPPTTDEAAGEPASR